MKMQPYVEKLGTFQEFRNFEKEYKDAFLIAGFFILDYESGSNLNQIDYYIPSKNKVAAFTIGDKVEMKMLSMLTEKIPEKLDVRTNIDLEAIKGILEDEMKNRSMTEEILKIIAVIQNIEGDKVWNVNCVLSGMEILKAHIEDKTKTVLKMERASVMDYLKKIPSSQLPKNKPTKADIDKQIKQLDNLKETLKNERLKLEE